MVRRDRRPPVPAFTVYPVETLTQFAAFYDLRAASGTAAPPLFFTLAGLGLQIGLPKRVLQLGQRTLRGEPLQIALGAWRLPLFALVLVFAAVLVALSLGALVAQSSSVATYGLVLAGGEFCYAGYPTSDPWFEIADEAAN